MREVAGEVSFSEFAQHGVKMRVFKLLRRLAMFDLWGGYEDDELAKLIGWRRDEFEELREHPIYERVMEALIQAFEKVRAPLAADEWVKRAEDEAFRKMFRAMRQADKMHVQVGAAREFLDRAMPKPSRFAQSDGAPALYVSDEFMELLKGTLELKQAKLKDVTPE